MTDLQARVDRVTWYHEFDFGNGIRARTSHENPAGVRDVWRFIEQQLARVPFAGAAVLDVGAWDGYWSFFAERQGASSVLATDDATQRWVDRSGIALARELLRSQIAVRDDISVYELAALGRSFDVILFLGVYYHLYDPFFALTQIRHCCHRDTIVLIEGELAWCGMTPYEARFLQSAWQECILSAPLLERLLRLAYFRLDEQVWMHAIPELPTASAELKIDRSFLLCRPFEGSNAVYTYRPHFGLQRFDDRFRGDRAAAPSRRAALRLSGMPQTVERGAEFRIDVQVTNTGTDTWRALKFVSPRASILSGPSLWRREVGLDFDRAFLDKHIVPGKYVNESPVGHYRRYIEENWLQGGVTLGAQLWDADAQTVIDLDYSRGFLEGDVPSGGSASISVRLRAPMTARRYSLRLDMVCEYVCWFNHEGSAALTTPLIVT